MHLLKLKMRQDKEFGILEAGSATNIVHEIRHSIPLGLNRNYHPMAEKALYKLPFEK